MEIKIPKFWEFLENSHLIESDGMQEIKEVLTILKYTTLQSISKFSNPKEIKIIELEFTKQRNELIAKYPHLNDFMFGSGVYSILQDVALKIKKNHFQEHDVDLSIIAGKVLEDGKKVLYIFSKHFVIINTELLIIYCEYYHEKKIPQILADLTSECVLVQQNGQEIKCKIRCLKCKAATSLSSYYTQAGVAFRINNFERHVELFHVEKQPDTATSENPNDFQSILSSQNRKAQILERRLRSLQASKRSVSAIRYRKNSKRRRINDENENSDEHANTSKSKINVASNALADRTNQYMDDDDAQMVEMWRKKSVQCELDLKKVQMALEKSEKKRRELLHLVLDLKGKVRVMARLRTVADSTSFNFELNENCDQLICKYAITKNTR